MNHFDRMPGPGPRGHHDGFDGLHFIGMFLGFTLVLLAIIAIAILLWNSFKVRTEVRALRGEVARLASGDASDAGTHAAAWAEPAVNHGLLAVPPAGARPPAGNFPPTGNLPPAAPMYAVPPGQGRVAPPPYVAPGSVAPPAAPAPAAPKTRAPKTPAPAPAAPKTPAPKTPAPKTPAPKTPAPKTPRTPRKKPSGPTQ